MLPLFFRESFSALEEICILRVYSKYSKYIFSQIKYIYIFSQKYF